MRSHAETTGSCRQSSSSYYFLKCLVRPGPGWTICFAARPHVTSSPPGYYGGYSNWCCLFLQSPIGRLAPGTGAGWRSAWRAWSWLTRHQCSFFACCCISIGIIPPLPLARRPMNRLILQRVPIVGTCQGICARCLIPGPQTAWWPLNAEISVSKSAKSYSCLLSDS